MTWKSQWNVSFDECIPEEEADLSALPRELFYTDTERIIITIVNPVLLTIGIISNLAFLFVMLRVPRMRTVTNVYLINLTIADICFLSLAIGEKLGRYLASPIHGDHYPIGHIGCLTIYTLTNASYFVSIYLITMVTMEKYYAICRPYQHRARFGGISRSVKISLIGWIIAFCFASILMPVYWKLQTFCIIWSPDSNHPYGLPEIFGYCVPVAEWAINYANAIQTLPFFTAFAVNFMLYYIIIKSMTERTRAVVPSDSNTASGPNTLSGRSPNPRFVALRTKTRNQLAQMVVINGVVFFVCLAPFEFYSFSLMITSAIDKYLFTQPQRHLANHICRILLYINSAINPFVYGVTNERYRKSFKAAFLSCNWLKHTRERRRSQILGTNDGGIFATTTKNNLPNESYT